MDFWVSVIPTLMCISSLGSRLFSTSFLMRRSMKGLRILCSCWIMALFFFSFSLSDKSWSLVPVRSNHSSKSSEDLKISGSRKLRRDHNSCKLFCKGVPVRRRRYFELIYRTLFEIWLSSFLIFWASSMIICCHLNFIRAAMHNRTPS